MRRSARLAGLCTALALVMVVGGCAKNGGFDPTDLFATDTLATKKKLKGERKELFPSGVPGATTGVPPDLVKGYQAPPEPVTADQANPAGAAGGPPGGPKGAGPAATADATADAAAEEPKPKPKPKVARAKASDPIWGRAPAGAKPVSRPTQIEVNRSAAPPAAPAAQQPQQGASPWPDPQPEQQQAGQSVFPPPPPPGTFSR